MTLSEQFGQIDIYLFDQLLRGRIAPGMTILDAGCGFGRNLVYLLREGYEVYGVDSNPKRSTPSAYWRHVCRRAIFHAEAIEAMSFPDAFADAVLSSAVLHFAHDDDQFHTMLRGTWRVLKPGGLLFCRLASSIGIENQIQQISGRRFLLPDGSERYLVDEQLLLRPHRRIGRSDLADP